MACGCGVLVSITGGARAVSPHACVGDSDGSGVVDIEDLNAVLGSWGGPGGGDLNRDGVTDVIDLNLVLTDFGAFCPPAPRPIFATPAYLVGVEALSLAEADLNRDGLPDLIVEARDPDRLHVLIGLGGGVFEPDLRSTQLGVVGGPFDLADFNGDGWIDLVGVRSSDGETGVLINDGAGAFVTPLDLVGVMSPDSVRAADFDGDGFLDIGAFLHGEEPFALAMNAGGAGFLPAVRSGSFFGNSRMHAVDIDTDGDPDAVGFHIFSGDIRVYRNDGGGVFVELPDASACSGNLSDIKPGDLDGDGDVDFVLNCKPGGSADFDPKILINDGNGVLTPSALAIGPHDARGTGLGDIDADGDLDILIATDFLRLIDVHINDGLGSFTLADSFDGGSLPIDLLIRDLSGDGLPDLAGASASDVTVMLGDGGPCFGRRTVLPVGDRARTIAAGDLTGDGLPDLAVGTDDEADIRVFESSASGLMGPERTLPLAMRPEQLLIHDLNGDGSPDLIARHRAEVSSMMRITVFLNGYGKFEPLDPFGTSGFLTGCGILDPNQDGRPDVLGVDVSGSVSRLVMFRNLGGGVFSAATATQTVTGAFVLVGGDFNGDGAPDICVHSTSRRLAWHLGDGAGQLLFPTQSEVVPDLRHITAGDFDGDGVDELFVVAENFGLLDDVYGVVRFQGGTAITDGYHPAPGPYRQLVTADINSDGWPDVIGTTGVMLAIHLNDGSGVLLPPSYYSIGGDVERVTLGDFDGDGMLDLAAAMDALHAVYILENLLGD